MAQPARFVLRIERVDRPLWQIVMAILILGLTVQRAAAGITLYASAHEPWPVVAYVLQGLAGVWLWASILWARRFIPWAVGLLGASVVATVLLAGPLTRALHSTG